MTTSPARKLLKRPIQEWPQAIHGKIGSDELQNIEHDLAGIVQRAALLHAYIAHRYNTCCVDQGHVASAKHANKRLVKIRKALGFSYPGNLSISLQP
jgi:hypothetical protein